MSQEGCGKSKNKATSTVQLNRRFLHISKHISVCKPLRPAGLLRLDQFEKIERNPSPARVSALQTVFEKYSAAYARSENVQEGSRVSPRAIEVSRQFIAGTLVSLLVFTPLYKSFAEEVGPGAMSTIETVAGNPLTLAAPVEESAIAPVPADAGVDAAEPSMTSPDISGSMTPSASNDAMGEIPSPTPSVTEVPAPTALATPTPQPSPTDFSSPLPFASEEPGATPLPEGTQTPEATPTPETTPLPLPTETPEPEPTPITTPSPTPAQDVLPEISPTPTPEPTNIQLPSATPTPEATPTPDATPVPDASPAPSPEFSPTPSPEISATSVLAALPPEELARLKQELREELIKELAAQAESTTGAVALSATSSLASGNLQERSAFEDAQCTLVGEGELYC